MCDEFILLCSRIMIINTFEEVQVSVWLLLAFILCSRTSLCVSWKCSGQGLSCFFHWNTDSSVPFYFLWLYERWLFLSYYRTKVIFCCLFSGSIYFYKRHFKTSDATYLLYCHSGNVLIFGHFWCPSPLGISLHETFKVFWRFNFYESGYTFSLTG